MKNYNVIIPARLASQRLPNKILLDLNGKPMIQHVYQQASLSAAQRVIVATDSEQVLKTVQDFGGEACLTSSDHMSGTSRLAEACQLLELNEDDIVVNVQGDEPLIPPALIDQVANNLMAHPQAAMATLCEQIATTKELFDPNIVKVVTDSHGMAMYFSRAPIAWERNNFASEPAKITGRHQRHIGIYAYRVGFIKQYNHWSPCDLEEMESLEQLRALWYGAKIQVSLSCQKTSPGIDTEQDLMTVRALLDKKKPT